MVFDRDANGFPVLAAEPQPAPPPVAQEQAAGREQLAERVCSLLGELLDQERRGGSGLLKRRRLIPVGHVDEVVELLSDEEFGQLEQKLRAVGWSDEQIDGIRERRLGSQPTA
jgi:hypothetical protein